MRDIHPTAIVDPQAELAGEVDANEPRQKIRASKGSPRFVAVLPEFVHPAAGHVPLQMLVLGALVPLSGLVLDSVWALAAGGALYALGVALMGFAQSGTALAISGGVLVGLGLTGGSFGLPIVPGLYSSLSLDAAARAYYWTALAVVVSSTLALAAGVHPKVISERLGHASITITLDTYSHVLPGMQEDAVAVFDSLLRISVTKSGD